MKTIDQILDYLDKHEIDYRLESNFCCGYIFYFIDGSVYPRRYFDYELEKQEREEIICESVDHILLRAVSNELVKDWRHRIEAESLDGLFKKVEEYMIEKGAEF